jgi:hypothetical protein
MCDQRRRGRGRLGLNSAVPREYPRSVKRKPPRVPFAEVVRELKEAPIPEPAPIVRSFLGRGPFRLLDPSISPERALELVRSGADVCWDSCGCGGGCGYEWIDVQGGRSALPDSPPESAMPYDGQIQEWDQENGPPMVLVGGPMKWVGLLD